MVTPPPFWPTKATEWVSLIGAVLGSTAGICALIISSFNYRRDRAKLHVNISKRVFACDEFSATDARGQKGLGFTECDHALVMVANRGRRPLYIGLVSYVTKSGVRVTESKCGDVTLDETRPMVYWYFHLELVNCPYENLEYVEVGYGAGFQSRRYVASRVGCLYRKLTRGRRRNTMDVTVVEAKDLRHSE